MVALRPVGVSVDILRTGIDVIEVVLGMWLRKWEVVWYKRRRGGDIAGDI